MIPLTINVVGGYFEAEQFLANLENLPRALRVTNLTMTPGSRRRRSRRPARRQRTDAP